MLGPSLFQRIRWQTSEFGILGTHITYNWGGCTMELVSLVRLGCRPCFLLLSTPRLLKGVEFYFLTFFFFLVTFFFFLGVGWVEAIPVTVVTLGPLDPLAI